jgi:hypothetical protein
MFAKSVVGADHRRKSAVCAAQALDTTRTEHQRLQSHLPAEAWLQLAVHDEENDAARLLHIVCEAHRSKACHANEVTKENNE